MKYILSILLLFQNALSLELVEVKTKKLTFNKL